MTHRIVLISAGMLRPKKRDNLVARNYKYLNYGLLGLASILQKSGYSPNVIHGGFAEPESSAQHLLTSDALPGSLPVLLSIPSSFAVPWAKRFCVELKANNPELLIVAGGRWVVGGDPSWLKNRIPELDLVVDGMAEDRIVDIVHPDRWPQIPGTHLLPGTPAGTDSHLPELDYSLLSDFHQFCPSIEVSRGCGRKCNFCAEARVPLTDLKAPERILQDIAHSSKVYENPGLRYYFEASMFSPTSSWTEDLLIRCNRESSSFLWRCETRADSMSSSNLRCLAKAGLRVIDLGLESASPQQLLAMNKTRNPISYIQKASDLLKTCADNGVWTKVNVLLYAGETAGTVNQTLEWLERHRPFIKGLSVSPVIVYRPEARFPRYLDSLSGFGAHLVNRDRIDEEGYGILHLSKEIDADHADHLSRTMSQSFMAARDFFELKSFGYFSPDFSYGEFLDAAVNSDPKALPFRIVEDTIGR